MASSVGADYDLISSKLKGLLDDVGMEAYPFKIGWYNDKVAEIHHLPYPPDTLAWVCLSQPAMFERLFVPYLVTEWAKAAGEEHRVRDPLDQCLRDFFARLQSEAFPRRRCDVMHDFELRPSRRPRVLIQTAGHVAGAAYYYQRSDVDRDHDPWPETRRVFGVSVHPRFGGWFALRAVVVFAGVSVPALQQAPPPDCVHGNESRVKLLESLNERWQDWGYRDITSLPIVCRYSELQKEYFGTRPSEREPVILKITQAHKPSPHAHTQTESVPVKHRQEEGEDGREDNV